MTRVPLLDLHHLGHRETGIETWSRNMARCLFELAGPGAYDVAVTSAAPADDLALLPARRTVTVSDSGTKRLARELPRTLRTGGNSAVLVQYSVPFSRVPCVAAIHDLSFEHPESARWLSARTRWRYRLTMRDAARRAGHVLALSLWTRDDLVERYRLPADKVTMVPAAVDPDLARLLAGGHRRPHEGFRIVAVGNVLPRKNLSVLGPAIRQLRAEGLDARLVVVGSVPPEGMAVEASLRDDLGDAVSFTGYVTREALADHYLQADVLAFPSLFEGFGIPILEAMSAGLPVVVADTTCLPEVTGGAGLVVPALDPEAWRQALAEVADPQVRADLTALGLTRAGEYSWTRSAQQVAQVLSRYD